MSYKNYTFVHYGSSSKFNLPDEDEYIDLRQPYRCHENETQDKIQDNIFVEGDLDGDAWYYGVLLAYDDGEYGINAIIPTAIPDNAVERINTMLEAIQAPVRVTDADLNWRVDTLYL